MKTIKIELGIDTATVDETVNEEKYKKLVIKSLREQLPDYRLSCSVNQDDNAETHILNADDFQPDIVLEIEEALVEAEPGAINDPDIYES
jgi:hypothetical protein